MLIAQITDIHLGFERDNPGEMNRVRLDQTLARLASLDPRPELLICSGDLTDRGDQASYERLREALGACPIPYVLAVGNHDLRGPLLTVFPETPTSGGFVQYVHDQGPLRIVVIDTLEENRHAGAFGPDRARWLDRTLAQAPNRPTLIVLHHPPVVTGIDWMSLVPNESWAPRLTEVVSRHKHVVGAICGHMHRPITAPWAGTILRICPSTAPQVTLDLKPMDLERPDERPLIEEEPPAYALHQWTPAGLLTFYARVEDPNVLLRFDSGFQPVLKHFEEERHHEPAYPGESHAGPMRAAPAGPVSPFGFQGRIGRLPFWLTMLGATVVGTAVWLGGEALVPALGGTAFTLPLWGAVTWAMLLAKLAVIWPVLAAAAKRAHDRGRSAWWLLILPVPLVGQLFLIIDLGLLRGDAGPNRFGPAPKG